VGVNVRARVRAFEKDGELFIGIAVVSSENKANEWIMPFKDFISGLEIPKEFAIRKLK